MLKPKNRKNISSVILFLFFAGLAAAIISYVTYGFDVQKRKIVVEKGNGAGLKSEMAGWNAYYSEDHKFKIDYPEGWKMQVTKNGDLSTHSVFFGEPVKGFYPVMIIFYKKPSDISFKDWIENNSYFGASFKRGYLESQGLLPSHYIDYASVEGADAYRTLTLSDTYFFSKVPMGKLDDIYHRCKCDYDRESVYILDGDSIIGITLINNMNGKETSNKLAEIDQRYEVESSDKSYIESKEIFSKMISSFKLIEK